MKTGLELFISKPITYVFPPETPLTMEFRGRHVLDLEKCRSCGLCSRICPNKALEMPEKPNIKDIASWARSRSLWVLNYFTGCCFVEAVPWVSSGFDMERFGLLVVGSPRHADVLIIGGYVTLKTLKRIIRIYLQMPQPKFVIAFGNCPMNGGTYWDSTGG